MKTLRILFSFILCMAMAAGCSSAPAENNDTTEEKKALPTNQVESTEGTGEEAHYKSTMKPFEELISGKRIVVLQSSLVYSRDGFYTEDTAPVAETVSYNGSDVSAYAITHVTDFLLEAPSGDVTTYTVDGTSTVFSAADFSGMYVIVDDFQSGNPVSLYNPETGATVVSFAYAVMANGEGIVSIITEQEENVMDLLTTYGWDTSVSYHLIATDKFYIPITPEDYDDGGIRGSLSGSINASFPEMTIAMGKMNDVLYIEEIVE